MDGRPETQNPDVAAFDPGVVGRTYDTVAEEYATAFGDDLQQLEFDRLFLDEFAGRLPRRGPVLDIGCGPGQVAGYLADREVVTIGIDLAPRMLQVARRRHPDIALVAADMRRLPIRAESCAGLVAFYSLPFLARRELPGAIGELRRLLPPGGVLGLATHLGQGEISGSSEWFGHQIDPLSATLLDNQEIELALASAHFRVDVTRQRGPLAHEHQGPRVYVIATAIPTDPLVET